MKSTLQYLPLLYLLLACEPWEPFTPDFPAGEVEGFQPIYTSSEDAYDIRMIDPQPIKNAGKLYLYGNLLLINEIGKGIHMIDNTNPANPERLAFIKVPGSYDMVIKEDVIYANNYDDVVALKLSVDQQVEVTKRINDVMQASDLHPQERGFYFECVDRSKGFVIGWKKVLLNDPECYR